MSKLVETLLNYYCEHDDDFNHDIEELDDWKGCLGDGRIEPMYMLDEFYKNKDSTEILRNAFFEYDNAYSKSEQRETFNPNRKYFYFNGYGNLVSTDEREYNDYLYVDYIQDIIDNEHHLFLSDGAQEIIDDYDELKEME
jgi:hypothetical protein